MTTPYRERFPRGSQVRIASRQALELFRNTWTYHNPLTAEQLDHADKVTTVREVGFYHGGDPLYTLDGIPGVWHETCLATC